MRGLAPAVRDKAGPADNAKALPLALPAVIYAGTVLQKAVSELTSSRAFTEFILSAAQDPDDIAAKDE